MSKGTMRYFTGTLVLSFLIMLNGLSQNSDTVSIRMMFYNVENLFDIKDDSLRDDNDFLPHGLMRWNYSRYQKKINSVYQTIVAAGEWNPPAVVCFCEVEKRSVLEDLILGTYLSKYQYGIIHEESADPRGIDVCLIYRRDIVSVLAYNYLKPAEIKEEEFRTRSVLYAKLLISEDTIHLFVNHWPSRRGGVLAGEELRKSISLMIKEQIGSILLQSGGKAKIIIAGDFNCTPGDQEIQSISNLSIKNYDGISTKMINLAEQPAGKGIGTYRFMGTWEMLDQVIISNWLVSSKTGIYTEADKFKVFKPDFLLRKDPKYPGFSPFSTYLGYKYQGGYSDHLPVIIDLKIR